MFGSESMSISVSFPGTIEPVQCLLVESGCFHSFIEEHDWHDVDVDLVVTGHIYYPNLEQMLCHLSFPLKKMKMMMLLKKT